MRGAPRARSNAALLAVLLFLQLLLMAWSSEGRAGAGLLESGVARASRPVVGVASKVGEGARGFFGFFTEMRAARSENVRLRAELEAVRGERDRLRELAAETARLRRLLQMRQDLAPRAVGARVVTTSLSGQNHVMVLDRGTEAGIRPDQAVVAWGGAVGRVVHADARISKVRLLEDPNSGVAGMAQRTRAAGMVFGRGRAPLEMSYVPKYADVAVGDRIVTSGLDGVFPKGFGIGEVMLVGDTAGATKLIRIEPEFDVTQIEEVLVLLDPVGGDLLDAPEPGSER